MMLRRSVLLSIVCACGAVLALTAALRAAPASEFNEGVLPKDGQKALDDAYNKDQASTIKELRDGKVEATKEHDATIDVYAKWYTYRRTWPEVQSKTGAVAGGISDLVSTLDSDLSKALKNRPTTQPFLQKVAAALATHAGEVLKSRDTIARMNAARVLWLVAHTGYGGNEVAAVLVEVLQNPAHDLATKYWACRGLQEVFAPAGNMPPTALKDKELQNRVALALLAFLDEKPPLSPGAPPEEVDGFRTLRREAIHALALTQAPAVADAKGKLAGRTAQVLLRVVRKDGFVPEPRWDEQVEAAIGIGWMRGKLYPDYQPDYAAYHAAYGVAELAQRYSDEGGDKTDKGWRYYAARLAEAFENLPKDAAQNTKDKDLLAYVNDVVKRAGTQLKLMETKGTVNAADFNDWLENHPPKSDTVYKGVADAKVTPGQATEK
jgi:hypothetical protein